MQTLLSYGAEVDSLMASATGEGDRRPGYREAVSFNVYFSDHEVPRNSPASAEALAELGRIKLRIGLDGRSTFKDEERQGIGAAEHAGYRRVLGDAAGQEVTLRKPDTLGTHLLVYKGPVFHGAEHGDASDLRKLVKSFAVPLQPWEWWQFGGPELRYWFRLGLPAGKNELTVDKVLRELGKRGDTVYEGFGYAAHPFWGPVAFNPGWPKKQLDRAAGRDQAGEMKRDSYFVRLNADGTYEFPFKGMLFWNEPLRWQASDLSADSFRRLHPFHLDYDPLPPDDKDDKEVKVRSLFDTKTEIGEQQFRAGFLQYADYVKSGLRYLLSDEPGEEKDIRFLRKYYWMAGSDAHGAANYLTGTYPYTAHDTWIPDFLIKKGAEIRRSPLQHQIGDTAHGSVRVFAPEGTGLDELRHGRFLNTEGPLLWPVVDSDARFDSASMSWHDTRLAWENPDGRVGGAGSFDGGRTLLVRQANHDTRFLLQRASSSEAPGAGEDKLRLVFIDQETSTEDYIGELWKHAESKGPQDKLSVALNKAYERISAGTGVSKVSPSEGAPAGQTSYGGRVVTSISAIIAHDPGSGPHARASWSNPVWAVPVQIDSFQRAPLEKVGDDWFIPKGGLAVSFTFRLSMVRTDSNWGANVEIKPLDKSGNSTGVIWKTMPLAGKPKLPGWSDAGQPDKVKVPVAAINAVHTVVNRTAIKLKELYARAPEAIQRHWFVVYMPNPHDPWGNSLNPVAKLFAVFPPSKGPDDSGKDGEDDSGGADYLVFRPEDQPPRFEDTTPGEVIVGDTTRVAVTLPDGVDGTGGTFTIGETAEITGVEKLSTSVYVLRIRAKEETMLALELRRSGKILAAGHVLARKP